MRRLATKTQSDKVDKQDVSSTSTAFRTPLYAEDMDAQHRRLLELLDEIGVLSLFASEMVRRVDAFACYLKLHFSDEEQYLKANSVPGFDIHAREHEALWTVVEQFWLDTAESRHLDRRRLARLQVQLERHLADEHSIEPESTCPAAPRSVPDAPRTDLRLQVPTI